MADQQIAEAGERAILAPVGTSLTSNEISGTITSSTKVITITTDGPAASELGSLGSALDTAFTSLTANDLLQYDGANWINVSEIDTAQLADSAVETAKINDSAVTTSKIDDGAVTLAKLNVDVVIDEDDMASDSATRPPSQQSVKAYVDGAGTKVLLHTIDVSDDATIEFDSTYLTSAYKRYIVEIDSLIAASDDVALYLQTSNDGGSTFDSGASDYIGSTTRTTSGSATPANQTFTGTHIRITLDTGAGGGAIGNAAGESFAGEIIIIDPSNTGLKTIVKHECFYYAAANLAVGVWGSSLRDAAEAVDGIKFYLSSGNITSGQFRLYGLK
jgi:hypothetical protein